jgi:hypothetical protein
MLRREVPSTVRHHVLRVLVAVPLGLGLAACFLVAVARLRAPTPTVVVQAPRPAAPPPAAAPVVSVVVNVPPPPAPPPPPPVAVAPVVAQARCPADPSTIGMPLVDQPTQDPSHWSAAVDGCVLVAWNEHETRVSRDGGATWASVLPGQPATSARVDGERVAVTSGRLLGVARPKSEVWRSIPAAAHLVAGGPSTITLVSDDLKLTFVTPDDGATWRTYALPDGEKMINWASATADGVEIVAEHFPPDWEGGPNPDGIARYDWTASGWKKVALDPAKPGGWSYAIEGDKFWGCGGSDKIVAYGPDGAHEIAGDLRNEVYNFGLAAPFAFWHEKLYRLDGANPVELADAHDLHRLVGVDDAHDVIALAVDGKLLRWSPAGGWRILLG